MIFSLHILKCDFYDNLTKEKIVDTLSMWQLNGESWFSEISEDDDLIMAKFNFKRFSYIQQFNFAVNKIERVKTEMVSSNVFRFDKRLNLIEFYGNIKNSSHLFRLLTGKLGIIRTLESPIFNLEKFLENIKNLQFETELVGITVDEYQWKGALIGKYKARVINGQEKEVMDRHGRNISTIVLDVPFDDNTVNVSINRIGGYKVSCKETNLQAFVNFLKPIQIISYA